MTEKPRPHRPAPYPDLTRFIDAAGGTTAPNRAELAAATAAIVVGAARGSLPDIATSAEQLVQLADEIGIDTLAALWHDAEPDTLARALWVLYALRQWCRSDPHEVTRLWRSGEGYAPADAVVAGVGSYAGADEVRDMADAVLRGAYRGDFAVALERAAAFFRVVAAGRRETRGEPGLAERNEQTARQLAAAAQSWRAGTLR